MDELSELLNRLLHQTVVDASSFHGRSNLLAAGFTRLIALAPQGDMEMSINSRLPEGTLNKWIRLAQLHFVDSMWLQSEQPSFWNELVAKAANSKLLKHTVNMAVNPWTLWPLNAVLNTEVEQLQLNDVINGHYSYLYLESFEVRLKRISTLIENDLKPLALRLQIFILRLYARLDRLKQLDEETRNDVRMTLELMAHVRDERMLVHTLSDMSQLELCALLEHYYGSSASTLTKLDPPALMRVREMLYGLTLNKLASSDGIEDERTISVLATVDFSRSKRLKDTAEAFVQSVPNTKIIYALAKAWNQTLDRSSVLNHVLKAYLTALVVDLNSYEQLRLRERGVELNEIEIRCSQVFVDIAAILNNHALLRRECLLTGFSLRPKEALLGQLESCVSEENKEENCMKNEDQQPSFNDPNFESSCEDLMGSLDQGSFVRNNGPDRSQLGDQSNKKSRDLKALLSVDGELMTSAANYDALASPTAHFLDLANVEKDTIEDLLVIISAPRWHCLSWVLDWSELQTRCRALIDDPTIHCGDVELKYLVLDYSQFEDESEEEEEEDVSNGIEKGYENRQWPEETRDIKPEIGDDQHACEENPNNTVPSAPDATCSESLL